jgi:2-dehydro-3-deoxyphosphooctonate aldolase (KDO 8-P synthase)
MKSIINEIFAKKPDNFFLIAGPCIIENSKITFEIAEQLKKISDSLNIPLIFKASYKKANRTSISSFSGINTDEAFEILKETRNKYKIPVITDFHSETDIEKYAENIDIIQIPAFLCRQTELLVKAGETGKPVNIKKGQFMSAESMKHAAEKVAGTGNKAIMLTERGTTFGYNDLVVDFRGIYEMKKTGYPVILDITHSLQQPNQSDGVTGGKPEMIETLAKAGIASGCNGIFIETHPEPLKSPSDGANMLQLSKLENLLKKLIPIYKAL